MNSKQQKSTKPLVGMVGVGWVGRALMSAIQERGFTVVPFDTDPAKGCVHNEKRIMCCDIVFVAVPTPTRLGDGGCDTSCVRDALRYVGNGKVAVIKSTIPPDALEALQGEYPYTFLFHVPEFLTEANAAHDAAHPARNIIGVPRDATDEHRARVDDVIAVLPFAPLTIVCTARESALIKYLSNDNLSAQVLWWNRTFDIAESFGARWEVVREGILADPRIARSHSNPLCAGRGAGGDCFIKDRAAMRRFVTANMPDNVDVVSLLCDEELYNMRLLRESGKDHDKLIDVYGPQVLEGD